MSCIRLHVLTAALMLHGCCAAVALSQGVPQYRIELLARDGATPWRIDSGWTLAPKSPALDDDGTVGASLLATGSQAIAMWIGSTQSGTMVASQSANNFSGDVTLAGPAMVTESPTGLGVVIRTRDGTLLRQAAIGGPLGLPGSAARRPRLDSQLRLGVTTRSSIASGFVTMWLMEWVSPSGALTQVPLLIPDASIQQIHSGTFTDVQQPSIAPAGSSMFTGVVSLSTAQRRVMRSVRTATGATIITELLTSGPAPGYELLSTLSDAAASGQVALTARIAGTWRLIRIEPAEGITTIAQFDGQASPRSLPVTTTYEGVQPAINSQGLVAFITQPTAAHPSRLIAGDGAELVEIVRDGQTLQTQQGPVTLGIGALSQRVSFLAPPVINAQGQIAVVVRLSDLSGALLLATPVEATCPADIGSQGGAAGSDSVLDNNDFIVFIEQFFNGGAAADLGSEGGDRSADGLFDNNDFIVFVQLFFEGC